MAFITEQDIKELTPTSENVDSKKLVPHILPAETFFIRPFLGIAFYEDLLQKQASDTLSITEAALVQLIKLSLVEYTRYQALPEMHVQLSNKGLGVKSSDTGLAAASLQDVRWLEDRIKNKAEAWRNEALKFILANPLTFPLYTDLSCTTKKSSFTCPIYFQGSNYRSKPKKWNEN